MFRSRRLRGFGLVALLALFALVPRAPALAQEGERTEAASFTFGGPVTAVDVVQRTLVVGGDTGGTFEVDPAATLLHGSRKLTLDEVKVGWSVNGNGDLRGARRVITYLEAVDRGEQPG